MTKSSFIRNFLPLLFLLFIISCNNPASNKTVIISANDTTRIDTSSTSVINGSANLVSSKNFQEKLKPLLGLWHLKNMFMIDKTGGKKELIQSETTIQFSDKMNWISHAAGFTAEGVWDYDNDINILTTFSEKLNGANLEPKITQKNKVIFLSRNNLIYLYDDPVTGSTLEMNYSK